MDVLTEKFALFSKSINYQIVLPDTYAQDETKEWPLVLFLHGMNRRGDDVARIRDYGLNAIAQREDNKMPFLLLTPQCPGDSSWTDEIDNVMLLLNETLTNYRVDRRRIYLTGFSMGGHGAWYYAAHKPGLFAAISPIAGWFNPDQAELLKETPIWNFHGDADESVPFERSVEMIEALKDINPHVRFTSFPGEGHRIMDHVYGDPEWYEWMLSHKLHD